MQNDGMASVTFLFNVWMYH